MFCAVLPWYFCINTLLERPQQEMLSVWESGLFSQEKRRDAFVTALQHLKGAY